MPSCKEAEQAYLTAYLSYARLLDDEDGVEQQQDAVQQQIEQTTGEIDTTQQKIAASALSRRRWRRVRRLSTGRPARKWRRRSSTRYSHLVRTASWRGCSKSSRTRGTMRSPRVSSKWDAGVTAEAFVDFAVAYEGAIFIASSLAGLVTVIGYGLLALSAVYALAIVGVDLAMAADSSIFDDLEGELRSERQNLQSLNQRGVQLTQRDATLSREIEMAAAAESSAYGEREKACGPTYPSGSLASHWGDPHVVTFDDTSYNFQQVGEFILSKSDADDFEVQVRQRPWDGTSLTVAEDSAVAFSIGGHRLGIYVQKLGVKTILDGTTITPKADVAYDLPGGGFVTNEPVAGQEIVSWPDGAYVIADYSGGFYLSLEISVPYSERGHLSGLLGNDDGNAANDITTRGGRTLPYPPTTAELYGPFSNSWRIKQSESLFEYGPGQSTETFTNLSFPYAIVSTSTLPSSERETASSVCHASGVVHEPFLDDCILDVAVTGSPRVAAATAGVQNFETFTPVPTEGPHCQPLSPGTGFDCGALHFRRRLNRDPRLDRWRRQR